MRPVVTVLLAGLLSLALNSVTFAGEGHDHAAPSGPGYYVVGLTLLGDFAAPGAQEALAGHVQHLIDLYSRGALFMAGPFENPDNSGQVVLVAGSADEARAMIEGDPSVQSGMMRVDSVDQWTTFFSRPDGRSVTMEQFGAMMATGAMPETGPTAGAGTGGGSHDHDMSGMPEMPSGKIDFHEIPSKSLDESKAFYGSIFGWTFEPMEDMPSFIFFSTPGQTHGGFTTEGVPTSDGVTIYINCDGVQATLDAIVAAGGAVAMPSMPLPQNMGHIAQFTDPHGNKLGLWSMAP